MSLRKFALLLFMLNVVLVACAGSERHERTIWYVSTSGNDSNICAEPSDPCLSLVEALARADADDQIIIAAGTYNEIARSPCTVRPCRPVPDDYAFKVDFNLWITGAGQGETIIDLGNTYAGFYVRGEGHLLLEDLTVQNARGNFPGGCLSIMGNSNAELVNVTFDHCLYAGIEIYADSAATLTNVTVTATIIREPYHAGFGIYNAGELTINGGVFSGNGTTGITSEGTLEANDALFENNGLEGLNLTGDVTLNNVTIRNNNAGNLHVDGLSISNGAVVSISDSVISENLRGLSIDGDGTNVTIQGGSINQNEQQGILVEEGELHLDNVEISDNGGAFPGTSIVAGIQNQGNLEIRSSHISRNQNGALDNWADLTLIESVVDENVGGMPAISNHGAMNIQNSLIANNISGVPRIVFSDGAVENRSEMIIANSTISGNLGTGIRPIDGHLRLSFVTIADNIVGLNIFHGGAVISRIANSLLVNNGRSNCIRSSGTGILPVLLVGTNIETTTDTSYLFGESCGFPISVSSTELKLGPLADNGGPTLTHALLPGSPALDAATGLCPEVDQRLFPRPFGPACDVGAYEASGVTLSLETDLPAPTPTPVEEIRATIIQAARCRTGPDFVYPDYDFFEPGQITTVHGRSADSNWFYIQALSFSGKCWIGKAVVQLNVGEDLLQTLRIIQSPPTPTPTLDPDESYDTTPTFTPASPPTACPTLPNSPGNCK
ncbi:MAG: right-handed parallel beta-helix repeat-containing protein [Chloroflexi bacterium]|nr:right-handed parallel beta-helix repeat-containing protein [Chloroflexota bacterium]